MFVFRIRGTDYAYILGMYLGDGCVSCVGRTWQIVISLDTQYPGLIVECADALQRMSPNRVSIKRHPVANCTRVYTGWKLWPVLFPQHGLSTGDQVLYQSNAPIGGLRDGHTY